MPLSQYTFGSQQDSSRNLDLEIVAFIEPIRLVGFGFYRRVRDGIFMLHPWSINLSCVHSLGHTVHFGKGVV
jgi:hypothetical protein